jgi:hypothetical protein
MDAFVVLHVLQKQWSSVHSLQYRVRSQDTMPATCKTWLNVDLNDHSWDVLVRSFSFDMKGNECAWNRDTLVCSTGLHEQVDRGQICHGQLTVFEENNGDPIVIRASRSDHTNGVDNVGYNPVIEAFSFLKPDDWGKSGGPTIMLADILSPENWAGAAKNITSVERADYQSKLCVKITFGTQAGVRDVVFFSANDGWAPIAWQQFQGASPVRDVAVKKFCTIPVDAHHSVRIPAALTVLSYAPDAAILLDIDDQTCTHLSINQPIPESAFALDESAADLVYYPDDNKWVRLRGSPR